MKKQTYQTGGNIKKKKKKKKATLNLDYIQKGFENATEKNMQNASGNLEKAKSAKTIVGAIPNAYGGLTQALAGLTTQGAANFVGDVKNIGTGKGRSKRKFKKQSGGMRPTDMEGNVIDNLGEKKKRYKPGKKRQKTTYTTKKLKTDKEGNIKRYKVVGKNIYKSDDVHSKTVEKGTRKGTTYKERSDTYAGKSSDDHKYGDKKLTRRRLKSKDDKSGMEVKRKEKITFDDGNQMTKRKQKKIKFGKNKGKIKSKTVNINRGKRTVTKRILNETDRTKLQTGGTGEEVHQRKMKTKYKGTGTGFSKRRRETAHHVKKRKEVITGTPHGKTPSVTKRKQKTIRFGKNKGKVRSKTVSWKDGKRSVKKSINTGYAKKEVQFQTGGFLEAPIVRLFED